MTAAYDPHTEWAHEDMARKRALEQFIAVHAWERTYDDVHPDKARLLDVLKREKS